MRPVKLPPTRRVFSASTHVLKLFQAVKLIESVAGEVWREGHHERFGDLEEQDGERQHRAWPHPQQREGEQGEQELVLF